MYIVTVVDVMSWIMGAVSEIPTQGLPVMNPITDTTSTDLLFFQMQSVTSSPVSSSINPHKASIHFNLSPDPFNPHI